MHCKILWSPYNMMYNCFLLTLPNNWWLHNKKKYKYNGCLSKTSEKKLILKWLSHNLRINEKLTQKCLQHQKKNMFKTSLSFLERKQRAFCFCNFELTNMYNILYDKLRIYTFISWLLLFGLSMCRLQISKCRVFCFFNSKHTD